MHFQNWAKQRKIKLRHIQPGKPAQNGFVERFNRTYRGDVLDANQFFSLQEVISITQEWIVEYNTIRPHQALNNLPPEIFAMNREKYIQNNFTKQFR
jgi:putative transposase